MLDATHLMQLVCQGKYSLYVIVYIDIEVWEASI